MIRSTLVCIAVIFASSNLFADPLKCVGDATKKLSEAGGYSWSTAREGNPFFQGEVRGKVRKDGAVLVTNPGREGSTYQTAFSGEKAAAQTEDGWQTADELENAEGFGRFLAFGLRSFKAPAAEVDHVVKYAKSLKGEGELYSSELTEEGAKALLSFGGAGGPEVSGPKGSIKITVKEGQLASYELSLSGSMSFNGNDFDLNRTSKVTISGVGESEFEFPEAAKAKLQ